MAFNEDLYLAETPAAREAIANGLYDTGLEYYLAVGRFQEGFQEGFFEGTSGNDIVVGVYGMENHIGGVATEVEGEYIIDPNAPFGLSGIITLTPQSLGVGEVDLLVGTAGTLDEFFLSVELTLDIGTDSGATVPVYVGMGERDYGIIRNFSAEDGDIIVLAGKPKDYLYESVNGNVEISTLDGDLVGVVEGVSSLSVLEDLESYNQTLLQSGDRSVPNVFGIVPSAFDEEFYLGIFPEVRELVEAGVFESGLDHYQAYGQYVPTVSKYQDFVTGTNGNDTLIGFGTYEVDYFPVAMSFVEEAGDYTFDSLGVGEVDTIVAVPSIISEFILSSFPTGAYDTAEQFYVGNGDADYARIQNLKDAGKGEFYFIGKREDFVFEDKEGDVYVSYKGDLVTIIEGIAVSDLQITDTYQYQGFDAVDAVYEPVPFQPPEFQELPVNPYEGSIYLRNFDEDLYSAAFRSVAQDIADGKYESALDHYLKVGQFQGSDFEGTFSGSSDSDIVLSFGAAKLLGGISGTGTADPNVTTRFNIVNDSLGEGELDVLVGSDGVNEFQLAAYNYVDFAGSADSVPLYIGQGNEDYALVRNFKDDDAVILSGDPANYKYSVNNGNFEISTLNGDLVGIVEGVNELQVGGVFDTFEVFELVSGNEPGGFDEDYYVRQFDLQSLIADGVIESGADHYQAIGQFGLSNGVKYQELITGTSGNDVLIGYGKFEVDFWGVGIDYIAKDVTTELGISLPPDITDKRLRRYESFGEGEIDTMISVPGIINEYILGTSTNILYSEAQPFYIGQGDADYALIKNIKTTSLGELVFSGDFDNYTFEDEENGLHAYYQGDLVAIFEDLKYSELGNFEEYPTRGIFVMEYAPKGTQYFNESLYLTFNPDIAELVQQGVYQSGLDHYIQIGQFGNNEGFFTGTEGNNFITGFGEDKDLAGVGITASFDGSKFILTPSSLGLGEIDTLLGTEEEDGFYLGIPTIIDEVNGNTTQALYLGEGTEDFGLIKNFSEGDYIYLAGTPDDYIYKSEGGDFKIFSAESDLIGIVKDIPELQVSEYTEGFEGFTLGITGAGFNQSGWVSLYPEVQEQIDQGFFESALDQYINVGQYQEGGWITSGTTGNDTLISWTQNAEVRLGGIVLEGGLEPAGFEDGQYYFGVNPTSFGVGEIDILVHSTDTGTITESLLGWFRDIDGSIQRFYVGQGDADYALVKNFDKNDLDELFFGGAPEDYTYDEVDGNLRVSYQGDLVTIVEGVQFNELELADEGEGSGAFVLIGIPEGTEPEPETPFGRVFQIELGSLITIPDFDRTQDAIALPGLQKDFTFEAVGEDLNISTEEGTLVAVIVGGGDIQRLTPYPYVDETGKLYLVDSLNPSLAEAIEPTFFASYYPIQNPDVDALIAQGLYTSYFDHFIRAGQFEEREDTFFGGTAGDDIVTGFGTESILTGVVIESTEYIEGLDIVPGSLGVGEKDVLIGGVGFDIFLVGNGQTLNEQSRSFYIGQGEEDYALIKNLNPDEFDLIRVGGRWEDYTTEVVGNDTRILQDGDLVAVVEGQTTLVPFFYSGEVGGLTLILDREKFEPGGEIDVSPFFLESVYLAENPDVSVAIDAGEYESGLDHFLQVGMFENRQAVFQGTTGDDGYTPLGNAVVFGVPVTEFNPDTLEFKTTSTGVGERDYADASWGPTLFVLGNVDENGQSQPFYVGQGDEDYLLTYGFDPKQDSILLAGDYDDYLYEIVDGRYGGSDLEISTLDSDLMAVMTFLPEDVAFRPITDGNPDGGFYLVSTEYEDPEFPFSGEVYNIDRDATTPLVIENFDRTQDVITISEGQKNYKFEAVGEDLNISTQEGTLVAVIVGGGDIQRLTPYPYVDETGKLYLVDSTNPSLAEAIEPTFFAPYYPIQNPDVDALIEQGLYTSYFDHFIRAGQFEEREDTFFGGTAGNDIVTGFGYESILTGVPIVSTEYIEGLDIVPGTLGTGEQDTLIGGSGYTIFQLGNGEILNDQAQVFYLGQGDADYALIKNLNVNDEGTEYDVVNLPGYSDEYTYETVEGNFHILKDGDLVAIVEGHSVLFPANVANGFTKFAAINDPYFDRDLSQYFNESAYLNANLDVKAAVEAGEYPSGFNHFLSTYLTEGRLGAFSGTSGNDAINAVNGAVILGVEVSDLNLETLSFQNTSTGTGEYDYVYAGAGKDTLVLGNPETGETFYLGQGDSDYFQIEGFDAKRDRVLLAGEFEDYTFETVTKPEEDDAYVKILKDGDLVAEVRTTYPFNVAPDLKPFTGDNPEGGTYLLSLDNEFFDKYIKPAFYGPAYLADHPEVADLIASGKFGSAYDHYLKVGQFEPYEDVPFIGTAGNDTLYGIGYESNLIGVAVNSVTPYGIELDTASTGVGEIDTLIGSTLENYFILGDGDGKEGKPIPFYVGQGDNDYALIKNFDSKVIFTPIDPGPLSDFIKFAGKPHDYIYEKSGVDLRISTKDGDLVAIIEDSPVLDAPYVYGESFNLYAVDEEFYFAEDSQPFLYEPFYLAENPDVANAIINGEYESAFDHYLKVGQFNPDGKVIFAGTSGSDFIYSFNGMGYGSEDLLFGVPLASYNAATGTFTTETTGTGEVDDLIGGLGVTTYFIGGEQPWYVGQGDEDYVQIENFDPYKDFIYTSGLIADYQFETVETKDDFSAILKRDLHISTTDGDLIAIVKDVRGLSITDDLELKPFTGNNPLGGTILVSTEYVLETPPQAAFFNEAIYLSQTPNARNAVEAGEYPTALDYYNAVGQFRLDEEGIFHGTDGNDIITGYGLRTDLYGVELDVEGQFVEDPNSPFGISGSVTYIPQSLGVGEIDVLVGSDESIDEYFFSSELTINVDTQTGTSTPLYVGQGDADYAIAKNFDVTDPGEIIILSGKPKDYFYRSESGDFKVYTSEGDLVGIVDDIPQLRMSSEFSPFFDAYNLFYLTGVQAGTAGFDEDLYLQFTPAAAEAVENGIYSSGLEYYIEVGQYTVNEEGEPASEGFFTGTSGNDYIIGFGQATGLSGVGLKARTDIDPFAIEFESTGEGEVDVLIGNAGENGFLLGSFVTPASPEQFVFYVGNGDEDYALIQNFNPGEIGGDALEMAGTPDQYILENVGENVEISYQGDLVAIVEGINDLQVTGTFSDDEASYFTLGQYPGIENFNAEFYLAVNPDVAELVGEGKEYATVLDYYIQFGQFREDGGGHGFFEGSSGNDVIQGFGFDKDLFGVKIAEVSGTFYTPEGLTIVPETLGVGEIDTFIGSPGVDGFFTGTYTSISSITRTGTTVPFYIGEGNNDYVSIEDYDPAKDYVMFSGSPEDYTYAVEGNDFKVSTKDGDLVAIIEDTPNPKLTGVYPGLNAFYFEGEEGAGFDEDLYLQFYPEAAAAVAAGQYSSALEYHAQVGQYAVDENGEPTIEGFFTGTSGNDYIISFGLASGLSGIGIKSRTDVDPFALEFESTGEGEVDVLIGNAGENGFLLGSFVTPASPEQFVFYVGNGDEDYALIQNFNPGEIGSDALEMAGNPDDYTFENIDGNVEISYQGDRVAIVENISDLIVTSTFIEEDASYFTLGKYPVEYFNADVYAAFNPDIFEFIGAGKPYKDVLDYYVQEGQFREDGGGHGFFAGSSGNDVIQGFGFDKDLFGVAFTEVTGSSPGLITFVPETLGVGEIDTFIGSPGIDGFYAAAFTGVDFTNFVGDVAPLYIGQGDADYVLIKGFDSAKDYFVLAGAPADYIYKVEQDDFKVYTQTGDLVAIIEDNIDLKVENIFDTFNFFSFEGDDAGQGLGFNEAAYLGIYPDVAQLVANGQFSSALEHYRLIGQYEEGGSIYSGTSGNDTLISWTQNAEVRLSGVDFVTAEPAGYEDGQHYFGIKPATYGVGEIDTLILSPDTGTIGEALLGFFRHADGSIQRFYVGQGDQDYALVKNFDKNDLDEIFLAGAPEDYIYADVSGNLHIAYQGDLVGIVEGIKFNELELADEGEGSGAFVLIGKPEGSEPTPETYFNESVYLAFNPSVQALIDQGQYESAHEYYLEVGQTKGHRAYLSGTPNGNDDITAIGKSATLFGVEVTGYDKVNKRFMIADDGAGEIDSLTGNEGENTFVLGNGDQSFYASQGNEDYVNIYDFNPFLDDLIIAGDLLDYNIETVETANGIKHLEFSTKSGDLVAILHDVSDLSLTTRPVNPRNFPGSSLLVSTDNKTLQNELADNFFEPYYAFNNPQAVEAVANGEYDSVYDYYLQVGRFSEEGIQFTYWEGTSGNDIVTGLGDDIGLFGVDVTTIQRQALVPHGIIGIETADTGVGTIDILIGQGGGGETVFNLGKTGLSSNPNLSPFYVGEGDNDYALIKNFDPLAEEQFISLVGTPSDYTITQQDGNTRLSYHDDLIALVEGTPNLSVLPFFSRDGRFFLASLDAEGFAESVGFNFYEDSYLQLNPDVVEAIARGDYESAFEHYAQVGRFEGREGVIFNGAGIFGGNDIVTDLGGNSEAILIGVPITHIELDGEKLAFDTANNGVGQRDTLIGTETQELFVLGKNVSLDNPTPTAFYVGNGDSDYAAVWSFDETQDWIFLAGASSDYTYETVEGDLQIAKDGDLVAIVDGVTELKPYTGYNPPGGTYLLSLANEFFSTYIEPYFYEPIYPVQNPDVDDLIAQGLYTSYYDHFLKAGQFELREDTFFVGTDANDTLYSLGYESVLVGVPVSQAQYDGGIDVVPLSTGEGTIDTLFGGNRFETIFILGNSTVLNDTAQAFYVGQGDNDYALIKNFSLNDRVFLGSDASLFTRTVVDGDLHISQEDDLIAIVEGKTKLTADGDELHTPDIEFFTVATAGNDIIYPGSKLNIIGVPLTEAADGTVLALTTGVGEFDTLYDKEPADSNISFYLGLATPDSPDTPVPFYIGNGDADYALIKNFDPIVDHAVNLAGKFEDYELEIVEGNTRISKDGDLVAIAENVTLVPDIDEGGFTALYSADDEYYVESTQPFFNESIYLQENPDVADAIASDEFMSGYQHFMRVGLLEGRYAFYNGTSGSDAEIYAMGNSYVLGVPVTGFDATTETFTTGTTGIGEVDILTGTALVNKFVLGSNGQSLYIGQGEADYAEINSFDPEKDFILLAGAYDDYTYETVEGNLNISKEGDLVAIVSSVDETVPDLKLYTGYNPPDSTTLLSLENAFFSTYVEPYFFEPIYPVQNRDVDELIAQGLYTSYYDHFLKAGQFEEREDTFLAATEGNDTLYSIGYETVLVGIPITQAQYRGGLDVVPVNTGTGQIDTLYGGAGKEAIFVLGNSNILNDTAQSFYLGNGDADYALIKNFKAGDRVFLGSDVTGFTQTFVDGNLHISKEGDLIAIVENRTELVSERENELTSLATESYTVATDGNDTVSAARRRNNVIGVPVTLTADNQVIATSTGANQVDTLIGAKGANSFILGIAITPDGTPQPLYVGNGTADYALIQNFSNEDTYDSVTLAGKVSDYKFEFEAYEGTGNDTKIATKDGDLIAIIENNTLSQFYVEGADITLYSVNPSGTAEEIAEYLFDIEPFFYEPFYLAENLEVADLISSGEYGSAFEHYIEVGQFATESEVIFAGTDGDDFIPSMGKSDLLFGVPLTLVDGTVEGWEESSIGVGEQDTLAGGLGITTFFIGNDNILDPTKPNTVYYVGNGDEDYALIQGFQPTQDFIFTAGAYDDYTFNTVDGDLKISFNNDLVAIVDDAGDLTLQAFPSGDERPDALVLVAPENQFLPTPPPSLPPNTGNDTLVLTGTNQLVLAGAGNNLIDATASQWHNRVSGGTGDDTFILGRGDELLGQAGNDSFFAQSGGDNLLTGGAGADRFWIASAEIPENANTITDFTLGEDVIGIAGIGASFATLTLSQQEANALITFNGNDLAVLNNIQATTLNTSHFLFV